MSIAQALCKHIKNWKKNTNQVSLTTQGGDFNTNFTSKVENVLP